MICEIENINQSITVHGAAFKIITLNLCKKTTLDARYSVHRLHSMGDNGQVVYG